MSIIRPSEATIEDMSTAVAGLPPSRQGLNFPAIRPVETPVPSGKPSRIWDWVKRLSNLVLNRLKGAVAA